MTLALAQLTALTDSSGQEIKNPPPDAAIKVQFNPESLEVSARNQVQEDRGKNQKKTPLQVVSSSEMTLSVQLVFDETMTGSDVRARTTALGALMRPAPAEKKGYGKDGKGKVDLPAVARFEWGNFRFDGTISEFTETLEYFSADGIPLRASVKFSMTEKNASYAPPGKGDGGGGADVGGGLSVPPNAPVPDGPDRQATQDLAKTNGVEDLRSPDVDTIFSSESSAEYTVGESGGIRGALGAAGSLANAAGGISAGASAGARFGLAASAVASGEIGFGASAGIGADLSAGGGALAGLGGSGGLGGALGGALDASASLGGSASFGASAGASSSLGFSASASATASVGADTLGLEAFAKLKTPSPRGNTVAAGRALASAGASASAGFSAGASASAGFGAGAAAGAGASAGAQADVGASLDLQSFLFAED